MKEKLILVLQKAYDWALKDLKQAKNRQLIEDWNEGYLEAIRDVAKDMNISLGTVVSDSDNQVACNIYFRPECPFNYCDDPDLCESLGHCHHKLSEKEVEND